MCSSASRGGTRPAARRSAGEGLDPRSASRLEAATKDFAVQLVLSEEVARAAGMSAARFDSREIEIRGRQQALVVRLVPDATLLGQGGGGVKKLSK